ncbi:MAG TPA: hypothetical protein VG056_01800, partial [Pirellulales bacterium]|nr:hypothetical protein [Pirellulales bacterium]
TGANGGNRDQESANQTLRFLRYLLFNQITIPFVAARCRAKFIPVHFRLPFFVLLLSWLPHKKTLPLHLGVLGALAVRTVSEFLECTLW